MEFNKSFDEIAKKYQYFLFDVWGVIHDGDHPYPNVLETIISLHEQKKNVCFLSNAPRRSVKVAEVLKKYGIMPSYYDFIMTSGEAAYYDLTHNKVHGSKYFYIGPQKDIDLLDGLEYDMVEDAKDADFAIVTGFDGLGSTLEEKMPQINAAIACNLPLICVNPDMMVIKKGGDELLCAGVIAKKYLELKGRVFYYGKPYGEIYKIVHEIFGKNADKSKFLAIGDGLETDIKGANDYGIKSVLTTGGILSNKLGIIPGQKADQDKVKEQCGFQGAFPDYVISGLI
jgi:HAD superfamily hydrolase (TIGR01459 family)